MCSHVDFFSISLSLSLSPIHTHTHTHTQTPVLSSLFHFALHSSGRIVPHTCYTHRRRGCVFRTPMLRPAQTSMRVAALKHPTPAVGSRLPPPPTAGVRERKRVGAVGGGGRRGEGVVKHIIA